MARMRSNVWELGGDWADPILWYARGVKAMKARTAADRLSWWFFGGMHDFDAQAWSDLGVWNGPQPSQADFDQFWQQCQHGSWYFLPWHRGYLLALEAAIRAEIARLPGAPADWALPYWNYFKAGQQALPPAFGSPDWPDGRGDNPLYVPQRFGPAGDGTVVIPPDQVQEDALNDGSYVGVGSQDGGGTGFGGPRSGFMNRGDTHGGIETQPHDQVHVLIGGGQGDAMGLMSSPVTAALDPIFWLHHANIDRLWEAWVRQPGSHRNPTDDAWLKGPASQGDRAFAMPMPSGETWTYTPADVQDLAAQGYAYDDVSTGAAPQALRQRFLALGADAPGADALVQAAAAQRTATVELLGANAAPLTLAGAGAATRVTLQPGVRDRALQSLALDQPGRLPDRLFLRLEQVRSNRDDIILNLYLDLPAGAAPANHPELRAGSVALFGARQASRRDGAHAGDGLTLVVEITRVIDRLHLGGTLAGAALEVQLVALAPIPARAGLTIGRVSVYREGH